MRIHRVLIDEYKNVAANIAWSRAVVLFGRNDAGKSNILEAIARLTESGVVREDPLTHPGDEKPVSFEVELDDLDDEESFDARLLARLLQTRHVPPLFPYAYDGPPPTPEREEELWGDQMFFNQFPGSLLQWDEDPRRSNRFKIGTVGAPYSPSDLVHTVGSLEEVRAALRLRALAYAEDALSHARSESYDPESDVSLLLDACLRSRRFLCFADAGIAWLPPPATELDAALKDAAARLVQAFGEERIPDPR